MGCCEYSKNLLGYENKRTSSSTSLIAIKETNLSNGINTESPYINKVIKKLLRNKTPKTKINKYRKFKALDKINEEESESKESSMIYQKMISKEKIIDISKKKDIKKEKDKLKNHNIKLEDIKILRKNRSHPKFKTKLNDKMFNKKLNEYMKNNKTRRGGNNYINNITNISNISQLSHLKESKSEQLFGTFYEKTIGDSSLKDFINKINNEKKNEKVLRNKNNNIYNKMKEKGSMTQIYEEEINKNSLQHHIPKSMSNIFFKQNITQ